jgi:hypothetical protein
MSGSGSALSTSLKRKRNTPAINISSPRKKAADALERLIMKKRKLMSKAEINRDLAERKQQALLEMKAKTKAERDAAEIVRDAAVPVLSALTPVPQPIYAPDNNEIILFIITPFDFDSSVKILNRYPQLLPFIRRVNGNVSGRKPMRIMIVIPHSSTPDFVKTVQNFADEMMAPETVQVQRILHRRRAAAGGSAAGGEETEVVENTGEVDDITAMLMGGLDVAASLEQEQGVPIQVPSGAGGSATGTATAPAAPAFGFSFPTGIFGGSAASSNSAAPPIAPEPTNTNDMQASQGSIDDLFIGLGIGSQEPEQEDVEDAGLYGGWGGKGEVGSSSLAAAPASTGSNSFNLRTRKQRGGARHTKKRSAVLPRAKTRKAKGKGKKTRKTMKTRKGKKAKKTH